MLTAMGRPETSTQGADVTPHPSSLRLVRSAESVVMEDAAIAEVVWALSHEEPESQEVRLTAWAGLTNDTGLLADERSQFADELRALELPSRLEVVREALLSHPGLAAT